jgi:hypothetical protein
LIDFEISNPLTQPQSLKLKIEKKTPQYSMLVTFGIY